MRNADGVAPILIFNAGSSSLKYEVIAANGHSVARGGVRRVGTDQALRESTAGDGPLRATTEPCADHAVAAAWAVADLREAVSSALDEVVAVGHRVVHGGPRLWQPTVIDGDVMTELTRVAELAPLHNSPALATIEAARDLLPGVPHVAVFDTGFHHDLPAVAREYALPRSIVERFAIRRYGFHGISCQYLMRRIGELGIQPAKRVILCHLGAGASITAVLDGRSIDTSMGFTPLEGLVMATRVGTVDPGIGPFLERHAGLDADGVERLFERESGLRGLSGRSGDYAELESLAAAGDRDANFAIDVFAYRARAYLGAYWAALGGVDLIVFSGGIGENSADARARILGPLDAVGWRLDPTANASGPPERRINPNGATPAVWVIPTRESAEIAREVRLLMQQAIDRGRMPGIEPTAGSSRAGVSPTSRQIVGQRGRTSPPLGSARRARRGS
ncbi:MAG: acetate/propionate family kinase [Chloroflexota bacterium]|nr:MAG: acetate/propionate family kinase [Chloroflexota bacterium]